MTETAIISMELVRSAIQNFTIIVTFLLLYTFVPERILSRSKLMYSLWTGTILGIAAVLGMPLLWDSTSPSIVGFNVILIPLAGFLGGPVSSVITAAAILGGGAVVSGGLTIQDLVTPMCGILVGALFSLARDRSWFPKSPVVQYLLLGIGVVLVELAGFSIAFLTSLPDSQPFGMSFVIDITPFFLVSILGTLLLGGIVVYIDRRKEAELELLDYKNHLEELVKEKTAELRKENALRKAAFNATADAIVVVDTEGIIRAHNKRAVTMLDLPPHLQGTPEVACVFADTVVSLLADPGSFFCMIAALPKPSDQVITSDLRFKDGRICEISVQPEMIGNQVMGRVYSLRDITEQRHAEEAIRAANNKLVLLSNITRHDILNQMTIVSGYLHLFQETVRGPTEMERIGIMKKSLEVMRLQIEFTRDYQDLGIAKPLWEDVQAAFTRAAGPFADKVSFRCETDDLQVFADPLIERVFYNLIDNSLRHGERVTGVRLSSREEGIDRVIVYEDDGIGIPDALKEKIFDKGFGKHTGLGMFLIREILSITGMEIRETGIQGRGVRFEIHVPSGKFRFP